MRLGSDGQTEGVTDLPRKAAARTARLAALPLGFAGRKAAGVGRRMGGASAEQVLTDVQQATAEQVFRTLGELKGGAMKMGQAFSVLEGALPEEVMAPYRDHLTALQDSAPPMSATTVHQVLARELGPSWRKQLVELTPEPTASASIGQVHRGRWADGRDVAVKVQYPGAAAALASDLRQISRLSRPFAAMLPGIDIKPLVAELQDRMAEETDYRLEAEAQHVFASAFREDPAYVVPDTVAHTERVLVTEWMDSTGSLARLAAEGTREERDRYGEAYVRFLFGGPQRCGLLHADPHPGNFRLRDDGRLGVVDFGAVARLEGGQLPRAMGALIRIASYDDYDQVLAHLRDERFVKPGITIDPALLREYLSPFVEPALADSFRFNREWLRTQFVRINDPREPTYSLAFKLNLPPSYLLIHRTWLGAVGVLSQLEAAVPFRQILTESLPGFVEGS